MSAFTLHLGFNWNSPLIGSIWDTSPSQYRFLQYALAEGSVPAWFQFEADDVVAVVIWDLSSGDGAMTVGLSMSFGPLVVPASTTKVASYNPTGLVSGSTTSVEHYSNDQPYLAFNSISQSKRSDCPWGAASASYDAGTITMSGDRRYKLSFLVRAVPSGGSGQSQSYLSDPEVIVGSGG